MAIPRVTTVNGLNAVEVQGAAAQGTIYLHGAHVASWRPAGAPRDILWMSAKSHFASGKPIRGGVPICFPWFGAKKNEPAAPAHGFARLKEWTLDAVEEAPDGATTVTLSLAADPATRLLWPHEFALRMAVTFGSTLTMELTVTNTGPVEWTAEEALHSYFSVGDARVVTIRGLEGGRFIDKTDAMMEKTQEGPIRITAETDRVYLDARGAVVVENAAGRTLRIAKDHSADTVIWNPWIAKAKAMADFGDDEWPEMLCVETCNVAASALRLSAGQSHTMRARVSLE